MTQEDVKRQMFDVGKAAGASAVGAIIVMVIGLPVALSQAQGRSDTVAAELSGRINSVERDSSRHGSDIRDLDRKLDLIVSMVGDIRDRISRIER